jgi:peptide/nickel transport system substrate-binding protein/oligopeptide transport system substrate-binding protein
VEEIVMAQGPRTRRPLAAVVAFGLVMGACGGSASPTPSTPEASAGGTTPSQASASQAASPSEATSPSQAAPVQGGTLSIGWNSDIQYFDPAKGYDVVSWPAERLIFEPPLGYEPTSTKLVPLLADGMPAVSSDGKAYTIKLRSGVNFVNPDGSVLREMTADDVVASFNRVLDPKLKPSASPVSSAFFGNIVGAADVIAGKSPAASGIKKVDDHTVEVDLVHADATFDNILATPFASIVPKETPHDAAQVATKPIGTGPFVLKDYTKGSQATFVRNSHYYQQGQPYLDEIDFKVGLDDNAMIQQIEANQLDMMGDALPSGSFTQITTDPSLKDRLYNHTLVNTDYLFMDTQEPNGGPLSKVAVRQALQYAIDKDNLLKVVHGAGVVANCIFPPDLPGYDPNCKPYGGFDQAKAKQMLADAGYPTGFSSHLYTDTTDPDPAIAQALQQDLAAVGVQVDVTTEEFATFLDRIETPHKAPMGFVGWFNDYPDPSDFIDPILSCASAVQGGANASLYCNKSVDEEAAAARASTDATGRLTQYQDIQNKIMAEAPWVPLKTQVWYTLVSSHVGTFYIHPVWQYDLRGYSVKPG